MIPTQFSFMFLILVLKLRRIQEEHKKENIAKEKLNNINNNVITIHNDSPPLGLSGDITNFSSI